MRFWCPGAFQAYQCATNTVPARAATPPARPARQPGSAPNVVCSFSLDQSQINNAAVGRGNCNCEYNNSARNAQCATTPGGPGLNCYD